MSLEDLLEAVDVDELHRRIHANPSPRTDREFRCLECGSRCTRLLDGHSEAGHNRECSRRMRRTGAERSTSVLTDGGAEVDR
ncbi:hypothetical protein [Halomontanus rarus]|uniref:hypothetical protein n=1 Tax=Halomontanus rarus TaxID=3034020 RepID=UPI001A99944B